jgi:hypothetical protein
MTNGAEWDILPGQMVRRREIHKNWGGQWQGGISTPANSDHILIFTDPVSGKKFGYDLHEGLREDGSYAYTGEGQLGDQIFRGGNKAILDTAANGKIIRLFKAKSPNATYIGDFVLGDPAYSVEEALDESREIRNVIVFNLVPLNAATDSLPIYGGLNSTEGLQRTWTKPNWEEYKIEQKAKSEASTIVSRVEFKLQSEFGSWLLDLGHEVKVLPIRVGGTTITPDLYDQTSNTIFEAKKSSARGYVRTAIGQVLDYQYNLKQTGRNVKAAILLPGIPADDLVNLCHSLSIGVFIPANSNEFVEVVRRQN